MPSTTGYFWLSQLCTLLTDVCVKARDAPDMSKMYRLCHYSTKMLVIPRLKSPSWEKLSLGEILISFLSGWNMLCSQNSEDVVWLIWKWVGSRVLVLGRGLWFWEGLWTSLACPAAEGQWEHRSANFQLPLWPTVLLCKSCWFIPLITQQQRSQQGCSHSILSIVLVEWKVLFQILSAITQGQDCMHSISSANVMTRSRLGLRVRTGFVCLSTANTQMTQEFVFEELRLKKT